MALEAHITELVEKHRNLDRRIERELSRPIADDLKVAELKKQKLHLKDEISRLQAQQEQVA